MSDGLLPSNLFERYNNIAVVLEENVESYFDHEDVLQNVLSALATQKDIFLTNHEQDSEQVILNWLVSALEQTNEDSKEAHIPAKSSEKYEWWMGLRLIHSLLAKLSAFEIHSVANQSIVFSEQSKTHYIVCLLLCAHSLYQCPSPIQKRWKRWQSVICESIRTFQTYRDDDGEVFGLLWIDYLVPALVHSSSQLPKEAQHTAILSALVGTTSVIVVEWQRDKPIQVIPKVLSSLRRIVHDVSSHDETWLYLHPWRMHEFEKLTIHMNEETDHEEEEDHSTKYQSNMVWWATEACSEEIVAGMDTTWDINGISHIAWMGFQDRGQTLSTDYIWKVWFPHVEILLQMLEIDPINDSIPLKFLERILEIIPKQAISAFNKDIKLPDSPLGTLQLLSNRLLRRNPNSGIEEQQRIKVQTDYVVGLMKSLLARYTPIKQIEIVECMINDCPYPGLQAKFLDFLRPLIFTNDNEASLLFWNYIGSFHASLSNYINTDSGKVESVDDLIENVEVYIGAITMVQVFILAENRLPHQLHDFPFKEFHYVLEANIQSWIIDRSTETPDEYYRLNLLECALNQLINTI